MARRRGRPTPPPVQSFWQRYKWFIFGGVALFFIISVIAPALGGPPEETADQTTTPTNGSSTLLDSELHFPATGVDSREHIPTGQSARSYSSNPPTSGPHWSGLGVAPTPWGIKSGEVSDEALVHNLEHGGIIIHYRPTTPQNIIDQLTSFVQQQPNYPEGYILAPRSNLPSTITLSAWQFYLPLFQMNEQQMRAFISAHYDQAPESLQGQLR